MIIGEFFFKEIRHLIEEAQKGGFLSKLLGTLAASMLGNELSGRGVIRVSKGKTRAGESF